MVAQKQVTVHLYFLNYLLLCIVVIEYILPEYFFCCILHIPLLLFICVKTKTWINFNSYINKTRNSRAKSEIRTLGTEISAWILDHNGSNPPDLLTIGRDNYLDPWKRPYVYSPIPVLEDPLGSATLNKDYDIYSKGVDGAGTPAGGDTGNKDDIVRSNDGAYVGLRE